MMNHTIKTLLIGAIAFGSLAGCKHSQTNSQTPNNSNEFIVVLPEVSYPLPVVDHIANNCNPETKKSLQDNPLTYILRGINDIWQGTNAAYQQNASSNGPNREDYRKGEPIIDSILWQHNIQYVINKTQKRSEDQSILAYLDDVRSKYYSVIDGFGPLTTDYVKHSGAYVDLPEISRYQVLQNTHYQSCYNNSQQYAGDESSPLGAVVKLARSFQNTCSSTQAPKKLFATPRPWRMNEKGEVIFLGTTYNPESQKATYTCIDAKGKESRKIFDQYESPVQVVPGLYCSRKAHQKIFKDSQPLKQDLYTNTTENIREDNGYPSGHTNAGALISLAYAYAFPERFSELVFRGSQLGEDRILAGMHSPVDVIGGKIMALSIACAALNQIETAQYAKEALEATENFWGAKADSLQLSLYAYAHQKVEKPIGYSIGNNINVEVFNQNFYDDKETIKTLYRERLSYGFPIDSSRMGLDPIVPKGAEAILKSRFPYLSANQRRQVLYTTEIPSGYKILDKTNGWGRINLLAAADGYGAFIGDIPVNMDASLGRFNANDTWGNDISGTGRLLKSGSGTLSLSGNNSWTGGTVISGGTLSTLSEQALGQGDVLLKEEGTLILEQPLQLAKSFILQKGKVIIELTDTQTPALSIAQKLRVSEGSLEVNFSAGVKPQKGDKYPLIQASEIQGNFTTIQAGPYTCGTEVLNNVLYLVIL